VKIPQAHADLARAIVLAGACKCGSRFFGIRLPPYVEIYLALHPRARSRAGARASCSRVMRQVAFRAAKHWFYAIENGEIKPAPMPETVAEIGARLRELGNWRGEYFVF
jgi:hypothetical protein